jgi:hypothetical protein
MDTSGIDTPGIDAVDLHVSESGDIFVRHTGANTQALAALLDAQDAVVACEVSIHTGNLIFADQRSAMFSGANVYVREVPAGWWVRLCSDGSVEEHEGELPD